MIGKYIKLKLEKYAFEIMAVTYFCVSICGGWLWIGHHGLGHMILVVLIAGGILLIVVWLHDTILDYQEFKEAQSKDGEPE